MNVNVVNVRNVYTRTVVVNNVRTSFNGPGGIEARSTRQEEAYAREPHTAALAVQSQHEHAASQNRQLFASENHGRPEIAATGRAGEFNGPHLQRASAAGEAYHSPNLSPREARNRGQMSRDNPGQQRQPERAAQNRVEKPNRAPARGEQKRGENERAHR